MRPNEYDGHTVIRNPSGTAMIHAASRQYQCTRLRGAGAALADVSSRRTTVGAVPEAGKVTVTPAAGAPAGRSPATPRRGGGMTGAPAAPDGAVPVAAGVADVEGV